MIPALSRFHVFVPWVLILSFFLFYACAINGEVRGEESFREFDIEPG